MWSSQGSALHTTKGVIVFVRRPTLYLVVLAALLAGVFASASGANTVTYSGSLTAASPTFDRPQPGANGAATCAPGLAVTGAGPLWRYQTGAFTVGTTGTYAIANLSNAFVLNDSFFALYVNSFDPANPLANLVASNDDANGVFAGLSCALSAGTTYILVTTPLYANSTGNYTNQISGPGTVTLGPVAVTMRSLSAVRSPGGALVRWRTASEFKLAGFNVYRALNDGRRLRLSKRLIAASAGASGRSYAYLDRGLGRRAARYWIQAVNLDGSFSWFGPARVARP